MAGFPVCGQIYAGSPNILSGMPPPQRDEFSNEQVPRGRVMHITSPTCRLNDGFRRGQCKHFSREMF